MAWSLDTLDRRERRLRELDRTLRAGKSQHQFVLEGLRRAWEAGQSQRPNMIWLREEFLVTKSEGGEEQPSLLPQLLSPRGIALRFYLLALFEAQCRLAPGK